MARYTTKSTPFLTPLSTLTLDKDGNYTKETLDQAVQKYLAHLDTVKENVLQHHTSQALVMGFWLKWEGIAEVVVNKLNAIIGKKISQDTMKAVIGFAIGDSDTLIEKGINLPDISKWIDDNTIDVTDIELGIDPEPYIFVQHNRRTGISVLKKLPEDIMERPYPLPIKDAREQVQNAKAIAAADNVEALKFTKEAIAHATHMESLGETFPNPAIAFSYTAIVSESIHATEPLQLSEGLDTVIATTIPSGALVTTETVIEEESEIIAKSGTRNRSGHSKKKQKK